MDYHAMEPKSPREQVLASFKTAILLAFIAIRFDKDPNKTTEQKAQELDDQIKGFVETIVSGIESRGISFVAREDVPKAFLTDTQN